MSRFGEDLIQSLNRSLGLQEGRRPRHCSRPGDPTRGPEAGEADTVPDGDPDGHEPVRLPEMGAGNAARQWSGRYALAHHPARTRRGQACTAGLAMTVDF